MLGENETIFAIRRLFNDDMDAHPVQPMRHAHAQKLADNEAGIDRHQQVDSFPLQTLREGRTVKQFDGKSLGKKRQAADQEPEVASQICGLERQEAFDELNGSRGEISGSTYTAVLSSFIRTWTAGERARPCMYMMLSFFGTIKSKPRYLARLTSLFLK